MSSILSEADWCNRSNSLVSGTTLIVPGSAAGQICITELTPGEESTFTFNAPSIDESVCTSESDVGTWATQLMGSLTAWVEPLTATYDPSKIDVTVDTDNNLLRIYAANDSSATTINQSLKFNVHYTLPQDVSIDSYFSFIIAKENNACTIGSTTNDYGIELTSTFSLEYEIGSS